jgi:hypothetical protein
MPILEAARRVALGMAKVVAVEEGREEKNNV